MQGEIFRHIYWNLPLAHFLNDNFNHSTIHLLLLIYLIE